MGLQGRVLRLLLFVPFYFVAMVLLHELGHATTATFLIPGDIRIYVWPGYELYPDPGRRFPETWPERTPAMNFIQPDVAAAQWNLAPGMSPHVVWVDDELERLKRNEHLARLMGSTGTLLVALAALTLLSLFKPKGIWLWLLVAGALMHLDMLTYTVFPVFLGVRHLVWIGGTRPEPVDALSGLGIPEGTAITAIVVLSLMQLAWLYYLLSVKLRGPIQTT